MGRRWTAAAPPATDSAWVATPPPSSVAASVKLDVPAVVGVPLIEPVDGIEGQAVGAACRPSPTR